MMVGGRKGNGEEGLSEERGGFSVPASFSPQPSDNV